MCIFKKLSKKNHFSYKYIKIHFDFSQYKRMIQLIQNNSSHFILSLPNFSLKYEYKAQVEYTWILISPFTHISMGTFISFYVKIHVYLTIKKKKINFKRTHYVTIIRVPSDLTSSPYTNTSPARRDTMRRILVCWGCVQCPSTAFRLVTLIQIQSETEWQQIKHAEFYGNELCDLVSTRWNLACSYTVSHCNGLALVCGGIYRTH